MNEALKLIDSSQIEHKIHSIRGQQVLLDKDLATLYQVETRTINQAVKRNIERFPTEFCFQLSNEEFMYWKSQLVMSNKDNSPYLRREKQTSM